MGYEGDHLDDDEPEVDPDDDEPVEEPEEEYDGLEAGVYDEPAEEPEDYMNNYQSPYADGEYGNAEGVEDVQPYYSAGPLAAAVSIEGDRNSKEEKKKKKNKKDKKDKKDKKERR